MIRFFVENSGKIVLFIIFSVWFFLGFRESLKTSLKVDYVTGIGIYENDFEKVGNSMGGIGVKAQAIKGNYLFVGSSADSVVCTEEAGGREVVNCRFMT